MRCPPFEAPIVPKRFPCVQMLSAQGERILLCPFRERVSSEVEVGIRLQLVQEGVAHHSADQVEPGAGVREQLRYIIG